MESLTSVPRGAEKLESRGTQSTAPLQSPLRDRDGTRLSHGLKRSFRHPPKGSHRIPQVPTRETIEVVVVVVGVVSN